MLGKNLQLKRRLLIQGLKPPRSLVKGKHSTGTAFLLTSRNGDRKIMQYIRITITPHSRITK